MKIEKLADKIMENMDFESMYNTARKKIIEDLKKNKEWRKEEEEFYEDIK